MEYWEVWYPKAGATGLLLARGLLHFTPSILVTAKADRMAETIEASAKKEGRYKGREEQVARATVHKDLPKSESHKKTR